MLYRLGFGVLGCAAVVGAVLVGCSSDDDTTNNNTTSDAGTTADTGTGNTNPDGGTTTTTGAPITEAVQDKWTFIPFPDSACANGAATGIGVNLGTSKRLVIYMEGGGACWSGITCYTANSATFVSSGWGATDLAAITAQQGGTALDRTLADNPFKDDNFVYVPYCTGDVHAGNKVQNYADAPAGQTTHHVGLANVEAYLKRLVPTFSDASSVILSGSSAGGFGAAINYERVRTAFGTKRVDLIDDSGPPFPNADIATFPLWAASWDLTAALPTGCADCATDITKLIPYYAAKYTDARFALLSYDKDHTIRGFFNTPDDATFKTQLESVITTQFDPTTNAKVFEVSGNLHTMFGVGGTDKIDSVTSNGVTVATWVTQMTTDSADWKTQKVPVATH